MARRLLSVAFGCLLAGAAFAQPADPPVPMSTDQAIRDLSSDSYAERDAATQALVSATNLDAGALVRAMKAHQLDAEAAMRVQDVLRQRFFNASHGAIGIQFRQADGVGNPIEPPVVEVVYDNYPAGRSGLIRVGDQIIEVDGESLIGRRNPSGTVILQSAVYSRAPGESVRMKIRRPIAPPRPDDALPATEAEIIEVDIPLGRHDLLQSASDARRAAIDAEAKKVAEARLGAQGEGAAPPAQPDEGNAVPFVPPPGGAVVLERGNAGQMVQIEAPNPALMQRSARLPDPVIVLTAWQRFADRVGLMDIQEALRDDDIDNLDWTITTPPSVRARIVTRGGGRVIAGPLSTSPQAAMRAGMDVDRNEQVMRQIAARGDGGINGAPEIVRNQNGRIVQWGNGQNAIRLRVIGPAEVERINGRTPRKTYMSDQAFYSVCEDLATDIASVESELSRLSSQREAAGDDLATAALVDEQIVGLRAKWQTLRDAANELMLGQEDVDDVETTGFNE